MEKVSDYTEILGLTPEQAVYIVNNDTWFGLNHPNGVKRYVISGIVETPHSNGATTKAVVSVKTTREAPAADLFAVCIDTSIDTKLLTAHTPLSKEEFAAVLFSVNGNKGPILQVGNFIESVNDRKHCTTFCESYLHRRFLGWAAYVAASGGYNLNNDPLTVAIAAQLGATTLAKWCDGTDLPDLAGGLKLFMVDGQPTKLFGAFANVTSNTEKFFPNKDVFALVEAGLHRDDDLIRALI